MKKISHHTYIGFLVLAVFALNSCAVKKQGEATYTGVFKNLKLKDGTPIIPDPSIDKAIFLRQYALNKSIWDKALAYLSTTDLKALTTGKYIIAGDSLFAMVTENPTKTAEAAQWESHRKYIDLHCVISGAEIIQVAPIQSATVTKPYDAKSDGASYSATGTSHNAEPGRVFLFFPADVHKPNIKQGNIEKDKKIVMKIIYSE
jgi:YhcH/YjgK/YiaL family protein